MATAYTPILKLALPVTGELNGTWGTVVNDNITSMVEQAVAGLATINTWTTNSHTLTTANGTTSESRCAMLVIDDDGAGNPSAAATVICPNATKPYIVQNICGQTVTVKTAAGTGVAIPNNQSALVFCNGTNVVTGAFNGDVVGPASATDNAIVRYDGATGKLIQNSNVTIDDSNNVSGVVQLNATTVAATTGNITTVNATTVDTTNIEVTNLKAKDGTAAATIADSTGVVTISTQLNVDNLRLDGNTISSTDTNGNIDITPNGTGEVNITKVDIDSGTIDGTVIGGVSAAAGTFTTATATTGNITTVNATTVDTTNLEVTSLKAKDGTAAGSIADSTGIVTLASSVLTTTDINGGTIDNTSIGATTASTVRATQVDIIAQGDLRLQDTTGGQYVALQAPGTVATSYTLTLPVNEGLTGQGLVTDGGGVLSWSFTGLGDVNGPASATDNAVARYDGTTGKFIQNSTVTIGDDGAMDIAGNLTISGTVTATSNPLVQQSDIGTAPNEVPLNQYLGALAYQGNEVITYLQNQINALYAAVFGLLPVSVNFVSLQDCSFEGTAKQPIGVAVNSTNSGNNTGWTFV